MLGTDRSWNGAAGIVAIQVVEQMAHRFSMRSGRPEVAVIQANLEIQTVGAGVKVAGPPEQHTPIQQKQRQGEL